MALRPKATSWWALSALVADRSGESPRLSGAWPRIRLRRAVIGVATWIKLAGGLGRANDDGSAVLCLTPPAWGGRARCAVVAIAAAAVADAALIAVGVRWWPAAAVILVVTLVAMATAVRVAWCCRKGDVRDSRRTAGWGLAPLRLRPLS